MGKRRDKTTRLVHRLKQKQKRIKEMAIAADPNDVLKLQTVRAELKGQPAEEAPVRESVKRSNLEKEASRPPAKRYRYGVEISKFVAHMIAKHGKDYKVSFGRRLDAVRAASELVRPFSLFFRTHPKSLCVFLTPRFHRRCSTTR